MDDQVLRGIAKWPNVPAVYGWLALDRRGEWRLKGEPISNPVVVGFINRNYEHDGEGRWFFQNGPQRVFIELESTPHVYRVTSGSDVLLVLETHTGKQATSIAGAWVDENGELFIETEHGIGVVSDRDLDAVLQAFVDANGNALPDAALDESIALLQAGRDAPVWVKLGDQTAKVSPIRAAEIASRFHFTAAPEARP